MSFNTVYQEPIVLSTEDTLVFGTCMLDNSYGRVKSAKVARKGDAKEILNCKGGLLAYLLRNQKFEMQWKAVLSTEVVLPDLLQTITFPLIGCVGHILDWEVDWETDDERMFSLTATSWDSFGEMGEVGSNIAIRYKLVQGVLVEHTIDP